MRRPIGVRTVKTWLARNHSTGSASRALRDPNGNGISPLGLPESQVSCPARWTSSAMSAPDCPDPTTSTGPGSSWLGVAVARRVQLPDAGVEPVSELGDLRDRLAACGDDHRLGHDGTGRRREQPPAVLLAHVVDLDAAADGDAHPLGVRLEEVAHVGAAGEAAARRREPHPRQPVVLGRSVEQQRVVAAPPLVADPGVAVEDDALKAHPAEVVGGGEAGLPGPDDDTGPLAAVCVNGVGGVSVLPGRSRRASSLGWCTDGTNEGPGALRASRPSTLPRDGRSAQTLRGAGGRRRTRSWRPET